MVHAMLAGMEADGTMRNGYWVPNRHQMYSAQVLTQDLYPRVIAILRELAGGALIMLPSSIADYSDPHLAKIIRTTQRAYKMEPDEKVKFMKAAWDAIGRAASILEGFVRFDEEFSVILVRGMDGDVRHFQQHAMAGEARQRRAGAAEADVE